MALRQCEFCGRIFDAKGTRRTICYDEKCFKKRRYLASRKWLLKKTAAEKGMKLCPVCLKLFQPKSKSQKYCSRQCGIESSRNYKFCVVCGRKFQCAPSDITTLTCGSKECKSIRSSEVKTGKKRSKETKQKFSQSAKKRGINKDVQKKGTAAAQKSLLAGRFDTNIAAKKWVLKSPEGVIYEVQNLKNFIRNNHDLFNILNNDLDVDRVAKGFYAAKRGLLGKKDARAGTCRGWQIIGGDDF